MVARFQSKGRRMGGTRSVKTPKRVISSRKAPIKVASKQPKTLSNEQKLIKRYNELLASKPVGKQGFKKTNRFRQTAVREANKIREQMYKISGKNPFWRGTLDYSNKRGWEKNKSRTFGYIGDKFYSNVGRGSNLTVQELVENRKRPDMPVHISPDDVGIGSAEVPFRPKGDYVKPIIDIKKVIKETKETGGDIGSTIAKKWKRYSDTTAIRETPEDQLYGVYSFLHALPTWERKAWEAINPAVKGIWESAKWFPTKVVTDVYRDSEDFASVFSDAKAFAQEQDLKGNLGAFNDAYIKTNLEKIQKYVKDQDIKGNLGAFKDKYVTDNLEKVQEYIKNQDLKGNFGAFGDALKDKFKDIVKDINSMSSRSNKSAIKKFYDIINDESKFAEEVIKAQDYAGNVGATKSIISDTFDKAKSGIDSKSPIRTYNIAKFLSQFPTEIDLKMPESPIGTYNAAKFISQIPTDINIKLPETSGIPPVVTSAKFLSQFADKVPKTPESGVLTGEPLSPFDRTRSLYNNLLYNPDMNLKENYEYLKSLTGAEAEKLKDIEFDRIMSNLQKHKSFVEEKLDLKDKTGFTINTKELETDVGKYDFETDPRISQTSKNFLLAVTQEPNKEIINTEDIMKRTGLTDRDKQDIINSGYLKFDNKYQEELFKLDPDMASQAKLQTNNLLSLDAWKAQMALSAGTYALALKDDKRFSKLGYYGDIIAPQLVPGSQISRVGGLLVNQFPYMATMAALDVAAASSGFKGSPSNVIDPALAVPDITRGVLMPTRDNIAIGLYETLDILEDKLPYTDISVNFKNKVRTFKDYVQYEITTKPFIQRLNTQIREGNKVVQNAKDKAPTLNANDFKPESFKKLNAAERKNLVEDYNNIINNPENWVVDRYGRVNTDQMDLNVLDKNVQKEIQEKGFSKFLKLLKQKKLEMDYARIVGSEAYVPKAPDNSNLRATNIFQQDRINQLKDAQQGLQNSEYANAYYKFLQDINIKNPLVTPETGFHIKTLQNYPFRDTSAFLYDPEVLNQFEDKDKNVTPVVNINETPEININEDSHIYGNAEINVDQNVNQNINQNLNQNINENLNAYINENVNSNFLANANLNFNLNQRLLPFPFPKSEGDKIVYIPLIYDERGVPIPLQPHNTYTGAEGTGMYITDETEATEFSVEKVTVPEERPVVQGFKYNKRNRFVRRGNRYSERPKFMKSSPQERGSSTSSQLIRIRSVA